MNDTTERFKRTLCEAFGPYTSPHLEEPAPPIPAHDWALYIVALVAALLILGGVL